MKVTGIGSLLKREVSTAESHGDDVVRGSIAGRSDEEPGEF
jgi:hypothetical protein